MGTVLNGEQYIELDGKLAEIKRQMRQKDGYPFDPDVLDAHLQAAVEGRFAKPKWVEQDGVITFNLPPTDGMIGEVWIIRLEARGFYLSDHAKQILRSKSFKPTTDVAYTVKVLKGELFSDKSRIIENIRADAIKRGRMTSLNAEAACLIRDNFTDKDLKAMGLMRIIVMHEPVRISSGDLLLLDVCRDGDGQSLRSCFGDPHDAWDRDRGFAFREVA